MPKWKEMTEEERNKYINQDFVGRSYSYTNPDIYPDDYEHTTASLCEQLSIPEISLGTPCIPISAVLTEKQLEVVRLVYIEGYSYNKAGRLLGIHAMSVADRLTGVKKKLRKIFERSTLSKICK